MIDWLFWPIIFCISLAILIKASNYFVESAQALGNFLDIPPFIIGVVIVSIGTSLPELSVSISGVLQKSSEVVIGNVVGSNIANIFFVFAIACIIEKKFRIKYDYIHFNFLIGSAFLLFIVTLDGVFTFFEASLFIIATVLYLLSTIAAERSKAEKEVIKEGEKIMPKRLGWKTVLILILSPFFIYLGAWYTIEALVALSEILFVGKEVIAETAVAFGTSLPELATTIALIRKSKLEMAIGNLLGSNIFNALMIMGISGLIGTIYISQHIIQFDLPVMLIGTLLYFFITRDSEVTRWEGWLFLIFYSVFIGKVINLF